MDNPNIMEQIAMYMVSLPCPPIPVLVNVDNKENEEPGKETVCSSHDLLAGVLLCAMQRNSKEKNEKRRKKQVETVETYISEIIKAACGSSPEVLTADRREKMDFEAFWSSSKKFTCNFLTSFDDEGVPTPGIRFAATCDVEKGSKVHKACCSWMVAQDILHSNSVFGDAASAFIPRKIEYFEKLTYEAMIRMHHERLVEEEERMKSKRNQGFDGRKDGAAKH
jgi:hypothetical protein